jgi:hypothetical protein
MNREKIDDLIADYSDAYADSVADMSMHTVRARVAKTYKDLMDYLDELEAEDVALRARVERLEQMAELLIETGSNMQYFLSRLEYEEVMLSNYWNSLVAEWQKEREE